MDMLLRVPDLSLTSHHPKRNFIRRAIELEIRLAYFDRIQKSLPEAYQAPEAEALPDQAPGPEFDYDDPRELHLIRYEVASYFIKIVKPHHEAAQSVLNLLRGRAKAEDVNSHIESLKKDLSETSDGDFSIDSIIRSITIQSLLHIGSRSFSHFLNAIERYLIVLRSLASSTDAKMDILLAVAEFWRRNHQMVRIVFDKLMQYQIVDPSDVIGWSFLPRGGTATIDTFRWEILENAVDKANGRVLIAKKRVSALRKEEDEKRAVSKATMEVDAENGPGKRSVK